MKTIDEVIKAFEHCTDPNSDPDYDACAECPYCDDAKGCCRDNAHMTDALHYLKTYRENQQTYIENSRKAEKARNLYLDSAEELDALRDYWAEQQANPALTWGELKQMFHKPVWIETTAKKGWNIIVSIDSTDIQVIHTAHRGPKQSVFRKADLGTTWQAYLKERT